MSISSSKAFPSSLLTSPSVGGLISSAAISQSSCFLSSSQIVDLPVFSSTAQRLICLFLFFFCFLSLILSSFTASPSLLRFLSRSAYPNSSTLFLTLPSLPPTITPSYLRWTSNRIHFPRRAGPAPVSRSWSLSAHLCLTAYKWAWTPCKQDTLSLFHTHTHTHRFPHATTSVVRL